MEHKKNIVTFNNARLIPTFIATVILTIATACGNTQKPEDSKEVAEEHNDAKFNTKDKEQDAQFLVNAAEINLEEIQLGQLSQQKATMAEVKELAKMIKEAHSKAQAQLVDLAKQKQISLPASTTDKALDAYKELNSTTRQGFDKAYCDMMVNGHKNAISLFEKASTECSDSDIRAWAVSALPNLRTHLDHALICQKNCEKM